MIRSYADKETRKLHATGKSRPFGNIRNVALRKLDMPGAAKRLDDLLAPPGNRLEALKGDREGRHSIRINDQWRLCFVWSDGDAYEVEIVDYHR